MSKKWTGQEFFLLGAAIITLGLMYITILLPNDQMDQQIVDRVDEQYDNVVERVPAANVDYAYKFSNGVKSDGKTDK
ncbi:hypothetical protein ACI2JA_14950 [Alkalihalobacillus sp. NPDC078783]